MPGIAGMIGLLPLAQASRAAGHMVQAMRAAGAAATGIVLAEEARACAGFVGALDPTGPQVAGAFDDGDVALVVTGECFDDPPPPLAAPSEAGQAPALAQRMAAGYRREGLAMLERCNGLFAGLLVDRRTREAHLFCDRYASERLYFAVHGDATYFASEAKALLAVLPECRRFDEEGVADFLAFGSVQRSRTLFRGMQLVPGGSLWSYAEGRPQPRRRYFTSAQWESLPLLSPAAFERECVRAVRDAVPRYAGGPGRIGIALTGGFDTRMILACMPETAVAPICYTFAGIEGDTLDVRIAREIAQACGLEHRTLRIGQDFVDSFASQVDRTVLLTDGCAGVTAAHEIYLTSKARALSPVRLTGNYGSEILRAMSTLKPCGLSTPLIAPSMRDRVDRAIDRERLHAAHPVTRAAFEEIPWHLHGMLAAGRSQLAFRTPFLDNDVVRLAYQAPEASRRSARGALAVIEAARPGLGATATDRGVSTGGNAITGLLRRLASRVTFKLDYLAMEGLPGGLGMLDGATPALTRRGILGLHKYLPYRTWFRGPLAAYLRDVLDSGSTRQMAWWDGPALAKLADEHVRGARNRMAEINAALTLEAVDRLMLRAPYPSPSDETAAATTSACGH